MANARQTRANARQTRANARQTRANARHVHLRVADRTAIKQQDVVAIRAVLKDLGFEVGTVSDFTSTQPNGVTKCDSHSCVGFDPGRPQLCQ
jgi:hypothetical protein